MTAEVSTSTIAPPVGIAKTVMMMFAYSRRACERGRTVAMRRTTVRGRRADIGAKLLRLAPSHQPGRDYPNPFQSPFDLVNNTLAHRHSEDRLGWVTKCMGRVTE